jgi:hydroxyacylglutathione hydrolase
MGAMLKVMIAPVTPFQQNCSIVWCDESTRAATSTC